MRLAGSIAVALLCVGARAQDTEAPKFLGHDVTLTTPALDPDGYSPRGQASVCIEGPPERHCYTAPKEFAKDPKVSIVEIEKGEPALLFSADSGGVSGWSINFVLLRPGTGRDLDKLLDVSTSNQNQHAFWDVPEFPEAKIFVTANFVWGPDEGHYVAHRFIVSVYVLAHPRTLGTEFYYLQDQYMTVRKYDQDAGDDILGSEKSEILSRLKRVKADVDREPQDRH